VIVVDGAHSDDTAMEFPKICDRLAHRGIIRKADIEKLLDKEDLGERPEILMAFAERIEDVTACFQMPNKR
jgi:hypothetical protein